MATCYTTGSLQSHLIDPPLLPLTKMAALLSQCIMVVIVELCAEFDVCDVPHIPQFFE